MEHQSAADRRFPERYLLGELSPEEAGEFEEHFFECVLCADEVRHGAHLADNLKEVLGERIRQEILRSAAAPIEFRSEDRFLDLTIALEPAEITARIECEFHFAAAGEPLRMAATAGDGSVRLRLPAERFPPGACTVVLRDPASQRALGQRQLMIAKPE